MGRKSKQPGGHQPLTYHERTKKFASSEYGTIRKRLAGHSQYQLGDCALTVTAIEDDVALCSPSGYLYQETAILEYLLTKTQELKEMRREYELKQQREAVTKERDQLETQKRKVEIFEEMNSVTKRNETTGSAQENIYSKKDIAVQDLKRVSYWLADAQPGSMVNGNSGTTSEFDNAPAERPGSPITNTPLRRKDLWPVTLTKSNNNSCNKVTKPGNLNQQIVCAVSHKPIGTSACRAYWTNDKACPGVIVLESVVTDLKITTRCPLTDAKIKHTRPLQRSGSSFAASGQIGEAKKYRPTLT